MYDILKIGLGELGMTPDELYECTFNEFMAKMEGARQVQMMRTREMWEQTREIAFTAAQYSGNMKKGVTKYHFMQFPWDDKKASKSVIANLKGEERKEAAKELFDQHIQALNNFLEKRRN